MPASSNESDRDFLSAKVLRPLKTERGDWVETEVAALSDGKWTRWILDRLQGQDPHFPYGRDAWPRGAAGLFFNLFRKLPDLDTGPAAEGLATALRYLHFCLCGEISPDDPPRGTVIQQTLELVTAVRARKTSARPILRQVLRDSIQGESLLNFEEDGPYAVSGADLHRDALVALSVLQRQGDKDDWDVWTNHRTKADFNAAHPDADYDQRFALTAFSGLALSAEQPQDWPNGMVVDLLNLVETVDRPLYPRHSLEALFVERGDQRRNIFAFLIEEVRRRNDSVSSRRDDWNSICDLVRRIEPEAPPYQYANRLMQPSTDTLESKDPHPKPWKEPDLTATRRVAA